jgi:L-alanine-DL-glutamate epimerase-like enolase superfamily enzyme
MKITNIRIMEVTAQPKDVDGDASRPLDGLLSPAYIYPSYREKVAKARGNLFFSGRRRRQAGEIVGTFVLIETDEGVTGVCPGGYGPQGHVITYNLKPVILGEDPFRVEKLWDMMYRSQVLGRSGVIMMAISVLDCALWDLIGKTRGETVCSCLGGPTRDEMPAYASALGYSVDPENAAKQATLFVEEGYTAMKWFFRRGPADGASGLKENLKLVQAIRDAVGYDVDLMLDAWSGWTREYALKIMTRLQRYEPRWVEEPTLTDDIDTLAFLRKATGIRISEGEREFTIWGFKRLIEKKAADILSPSLTYCGGFSQFRKIAAMAEVAGLQVIPHDGFIGVLHAMLSQSPAICPIGEYLIKSNLRRQNLFKEGLYPQNGILKLPDKPGLGLELNEEIITHKRFLEF